MIKIQRYIDHYYHITKVKVLKNVTLYILSYYPCKDTVRLLVSLFYVEGE